MQKKKKKKSGVRLTIEWSEGRTWKRTSWPSESNWVVAENNLNTERERERDAEGESAWRVVACSVSGTVPDSKFLRIGFDQTAWSPDLIRLLSGGLGTICWVQWLASKLHVLSYNVFIKDITRKKYFSEITQIEKTLHYSSWIISETH